MQYFSTRGAGPVTLDDALRLGIASDGGLFLPESLPEFSVADFDGAETIPQVAHVLLSPFFAGSSLAGELVACEIVLEAYRVRPPSSRRLQVRLGALPAALLEHVAADERPTEPALDARLVRSLLSH